MNGITHKQAKRFMHAELDGLLTDSQRYELDAHLRECEACRVESESLSVLTARLKNNFQGRWDAQDGPSQKVMANIHSQTRRIIMSNRIRFGMRTLAGIGALVVLGFVINFAFAQLRNPSITVSGIDATNGVKPVEQLPLIAFVSNQSGNEEIFTMHADGSGLTNITNNLATDTSPAWSPDGTRIAFGSDRKGDMDIYVMDADGSNLSRLTDDRGYEGYFSWSPDGQKIVYVSSDNSLNENGQLMTMNADGSNKITLTSEQGSYNFLDWSPDGKKILFEDLNSYPNDSGMRYVDDVGSNTGDGLMGVGDGLHRYARWENSDQYVFASLSGTWDSPKWELISFYAIDPSPQYNYGPVLYSSDSPIVAIFDRTFIVENNNALTWLVYEGGPLPFSSWDFNERCIEPSNLFQEDSTHIVSPNRQQAFVVIHCAEGTTWFYLENADGSQFVQLTDFSLPDPSQVIDTGWSPDEKYVTVIINRIKGDQYVGADLYLFDIEKMLKDPSTDPIQLTTDGALKYGAVWQPIPNNNIVEEKPTPEPTITSSYDGLIAFVSGQEAGNEEIYTMHADGSGLTNITNNLATDTTPVWSPDGKRIAFGSDRNGDMDIYVMDAGGSNLTRLTDDRGYEGYFSWSPDGQRIVYTASDNSLINDEQLVVMNADGSNKTALTEPGDYIFLGWSPNGQKIVYLNQNSEKIQDNEIHIVDINGANHYKWRAIIDEIKWTDEGHFIGHGWSGISELPSWNIYKFDAEGSDPIELATYPSRVVALFNQSYLVEDLRTLSWYSLDGTTAPMKSWDFGSHCKMQGDRFMQETGHAISPDETRAFVTVYCFEGTRWFYLENTDGSKFLQLTDFSVTDPSQVIDTSWSPDEKYVTVAIASSNGDTAGIYLFDIEEMLNDPSTKPIQLTTDGAIKGGAFWQPIPNNIIVEEKPTPEPTPTSSYDNLVAFVSDQNGNPDIYTTHADGSSLTNLTNNAAHDINPFWSPDGTRIAFQSDRTGLMQIYVMNADGSNLVQLTNNQVNHELMSYHGPWSPDGRKLLFTEWAAPDAAKWKLFAIGVDGKDKTFLADVPPVYTSPSWSPDGKYVAFISNSRLYVVDSSGNNLTEITKSLPTGEVMDSYNLPNYYWTPDSQSIIFIASNIDYVEGRTQGGEPNVNLFHWNAYEASLDGRTLVLNATTHSPLGGWWQGNYFSTPFVGVRPWTWTGSYGVRTVDPFRNCTDLSGGGYILKQTPKGNVAIGAMCPNGDWWLFMVNPQGVISPLIASPIPTVQGSLDRLSWSPNDKFIAFNLTSNGKTELYLVNVTEALKDPSIKPVQVSIGSGTENNPPSWQPQP